MTGEADRAEIPLTGGRITPGVVRIGDTVRRPVGEHSPFVHELLRHLEEHGFAKAPRFLGIDDQEREILSFLPGETAATFMARNWSQPQITAAGRLLRELHDVTADTPLADGEETVCHNDFSPLEKVLQRLTVRNAGLITECACRTTSNKVRRYQTR